MHSELSDSSIEEEASISVATEVKPTTDGALEPAVTLQFAGHTNDIPRVETITAPSVHETATASVMKPAVSAHPAEVLDAYESDFLESEYPSDYAEEIVEELLHKPPTPGASPLPVTPPPSTWMQLGILDPNHGSGDQKAAQSLSRTDKIPAMTALIARLQRNKAPAVGAAQSELEGLAASACVSATAVSSLVRQLRSVPLPTHKAHCATQAAWNPILMQAPRSQARSRMERLQEEWTVCEDNMRNSSQLETASPLSAGVDPTEPSVPSRFPPSAKPLQLATAQLRVHAALASMHTHYFGNIFPLPAEQTEFGRAEIRELVVGRKLSDAPSMSSYSTPASSYVIVASETDSDWTAPLLTHLQSQQPLISSSSVGECEVLQARLLQLHSLSVKARLYHSANQSMR
jgi:hypothetical protein